jgi:hypothetical protein
MADPCAYRRIDNDCDAKFTTIEVVKEKQLKKITAVRSGKGQCADESRVICDGNCMMKQYTPPVGICDGERLKILADSEGDLGNSWCRGFFPVTMLEGNCEVIPRAGIAEIQYFALPPIIKIIAK